MRMCVSVWMWVGVSIRITSVSYICLRAFVPLLLCILMKALHITVSQSSCFGGTLKNMDLNTSRTNYNVCDECWSVLYESWCSVFLH